MCPLHMPQSDTHRGPNFFFKIIRVTCTLPVIVINILLLSRRLGDHLTSSLPSNPAITGNVRDESIHAQYNAQWEENRRRVPCASSEVNDWDQNRVHTNCETKGLFPP